MTSEPGYAEVAVSVPLRETFHYKIPANLRSKLQPGMRVSVPFGHREVTGTMVGWVAKPDVAKLRPISRLLDEEPLLDSSMVELARWMADLYQTGWGETLAALIPSSLRRGKKGMKSRIEESAPAALPTIPLQFTSSQKLAYERIHTAVTARRHEIFLLHGITGSGKTEIYLQIIREVLQQGRSAIVLVPEISLTPQAIERFQGRFGPETVAVLHSGMLESRRMQEWQRIRGAQARVVVGARSAIFAPVRNLGLVVLDEEHEPSYKQDDSPRYHAREVGIHRAEMAQAAVILGSATPSMESYHAATTPGPDGGAPRIHLLELRSRIDEVPLPEVQIVDMRREREGGRRSRIFSRPLEETLAQILGEHQQAILFLNRRGFSTFIHCRRCGFVLKCDLCRLPLTYHMAQKQMICHSCSRAVPPPDVCPKCESDYVRFQGIGTEKVESELARLFPAASIARMDSDATQLRGSHAQILNAFSEHKIDVLVGTQMIAKGLDFPKVTLVGVISADTALNLPDFRAAERTFNLLTQVGGRAGRARLPGKVIVQTYTPHHYAILAAKDHDYHSFYKQEIAIRRDLGLPPFTRLARLTARALKETKASEFAGKLATACRRGFPPQVQVIGPAPSEIPKLRRQYRWQVLLKTTSIDLLKKNLAQVLKTCKPPSGCYLAVDVDPL